MTHGMEVIQNALNLLMMLVGIYTTLLGFKVVRGSTATKEKYEKWHGSFGVHLKWLGPLIVIGSIWTILLR